MIYAVIGTTAQVIKVIPVLKEMDSRGMEYRIIHTGQHPGSASLLELFGVKNKPHFLSRNREPVASVSRGLALTLENVIRAKVRSSEFFPQKGLVLTQGDDISTLQGMLISRVLRMKLAHIEAGLRSYNRLNPFPEEIIRTLVDASSDFLFPTRWAAGALDKARGQVIDTGFNTVYDSLLLAKKMGSSCARDSMPRGRYAIASIHRFETIYSRKRLGVVMRTLDRISGVCKIILMLHGTTEKMLKKHGYMDSLSNNKAIQISPIKDYVSFIHVLSGAEFVVTDSGGLQEECYYLNVPCLLLRETTERQEGMGENVCLSKFDSEIIERFVQTYQHYRHNERFIDASPSRIIVDALEKIAV